MLLPLLPPAPPLPPFAPVASPPLPAVALPPLPLAPPAETPPSPPWPFASIVRFVAENVWAELAAEWDRVKDSPEERRVFINTSLAEWTAAEVWDYVRERDVPYHSLYDRGYTSIGCQPCTTLPTDGDPRSGRWAGRGKTECGLHV